MRRAIAAFVIVLMTAASAGAVTLKDIVDLTKAGLGDDVLLALIEVDGGVFDVDATTLTSLKAAGVSQKVIVALVRSGRERPVPENQQLSEVVAAQQAPEVIYVEQPPTTIVREVAVPVAVPFYVAVPVGGSHGRRRHSDAADSLQPSIAAPPAIQGRQHYLTDVPAPKQQEPVYWGSGGKLRPDAWKPKE